MCPAVPDAVEPTGLHRHPRKVIHRAAGPGGRTYTTLGFDHFPAHLSGRSRWPHHSNSNFTNTHTTTSANKDTMPTRTDKYPCLETVRNSRRRSRGSSNGHRRGISQSTFSRFRYKPTCHQPSRAHPAKNTIPARRAGVPIVSPDATATAIALPRPPHRPEEEPNR